MTQPSGQQIEVALDALRDEGITWNTMARQTEELAGIAGGLVLDVSHFSGIGHLIGIDSVYQELQVRVTGLLSQAAANFDATGVALRTSADAYQHEEDLNMHEISGTY